MFWFPSSSHSPLGLSLVCSLSSIQVEAVSDRMQTAGDGFILLIAGYSERCTACHNVLSELERVSAMILAYFHRENSPKFSWKGRELPQIGLVNCDEVDAAAVRSLGITTVPTLHFFHRPAGNDSRKGDVVMTNLAGPADTAEQIFAAVMHHWYRVEPTMSIESIHDLSGFIRQHGPGIFSDAPVPINSDYSNDEHARITTMMEDVGMDPHVVFLLCQDNLIANTMLRDDFVALASAMSTHRATVYVQVKRCFVELEDDEIPSKQHNNRHRQQQKQQQQQFRGLTVASYLVDREDWSVSYWNSKPSQMSLDEFIVRQATPSVLWFDRIGTAPIAFSRYRKLHAVLIVPLLGTGRINSSDAVRAFRSACRKHRVLGMDKPLANENGTPDPQSLRNDDIVCLVVPDTETRVLTTFGIDIWSPLDEKATIQPSANQNDGETYDGTDARNGRENQDARQTSFRTDDGSMLPLVFITDQRDGRMQRYHLGAAALAGTGEKVDTPEQSIEQFFDSFRKNHLDPEMKTESNNSTRTPAINMYGVRFVTAEGFRTTILERSHDEHCLLYLSSPTCGHCKRFSAVVWNPLALLVNALGWDDRLNVLQIDATKNDLSGEDMGLDPAFLPAVYYFPAGSSPRLSMRYEPTNDRFGDGVGGLDEPFPIIDWIVSLRTGFDEGSLVQKLYE